MLLDAVLPAGNSRPGFSPKFQVALSGAAARVTGETGDALKRRLRTAGCDDGMDATGNCASPPPQAVQQSRAIANRTLEAPPFGRQWVPASASLRRPSSCVSTGPLHGEIKLPGAANASMRRAIGEHIRIGIET